MAENKLSAFRVQRGIHKRTLTRLEKKVSETDTITHRLAASWLTEIQSTLDKFMPIQIEIEVLAQEDPDLCKLEENEGDAFQDRCMELRLKLEDILEEHQQSSRNHNDTSKDNMLPEVLQNQTNLLQHIVKLQTEGPSSSSSFSARTKLPQLNLPTFNGQYTEWMRFRDAFHSTIHSNPDLRPNQKMQYLKMALTGSAAEDISHVQISDDNYEPTWQRLTKRYEKKVHLINAFIDQFMAQSKQKVDTVDDLLQANRKYRQIFDSMKALGDDCLKLDVWLIYLMKQNMSEKFRTKWEESRDSENMASVDDFFDFMEKATDVMERANLGLQDTTKAPPKGAPKQPEKAPSKPSKGGIATHHTETGKCHKCGGAHPLYQCESFKALPVEERGRLVSKSSLCFNCIRGNHPAKKCTSQSRCRLCGKAHHTLLHIDVQQAQIPKQFVPPQGQPLVAPQSPTVPQQLMPPQDTQTPSTSSMVTTHHSMVPKRALLPTALVNILDAHGNNQVCRVLIDGGGECTMISEDCAQRLLLPRSNAKIPVTGAAEVTVGYTKGLVHLSMSSIHDEDSKLQAEAYVMQKLTAFLPSVPISHMSWPHIDSLKLADPGYKTPGKIDVILGGEYVPYITLPQILKGNNDEPVAQLTIFGWTAAGKIPSEVRGFTSMHTHCDLDDSLKKFWMSENVPSDKKKCYTKEEQFCEDHFAKTHTRDESGRYVVELAFKEDHEELGDSSKAALARLQTMERRFARDPEFKAEYIKFMDEYLQLGHMEEVPYDQLYKPHNKRYFLPHQAVLRPSSETTKLRVVFDASAPTPPNNKSLNDNLAVGPVLQDDLFTILVRHRTYVIAFCADAEKMYRQIGVAIEYRDYLSLFWRPDPSQKIRQYRLKTVTYGTSSAPYLATKVLQQIALDYTSEFPEAARAILSCFYMDDLLCGASNLEEAKKLCKDIQEVLQRAKFTLRKWCSNSSELLADIPSHLQALSPEEVTAQSKTITALGLQWAPGQDELSILTEALPQVITKRDFCAAAAKIFDPLGFLSPFTVKLKMMFQSLWLSGMGWDDALPQELVDTYEDFRTQYSALKELKIRRNIPSKGGVIELHGFADASERAFGAVVYAKGEDSEGNPVIAIVTAKSRVAPVKIVSIPRLELNACLLLATLLDKVKDAITNFEVKVHAWSDSMVALQWIQDSPKRWTPYVANRVSMIQDYFPPSIWRHVSTLDNPADCVSRGLSPTELKDHHLWWQGPQWLLEEESNWPKTEIKKSTTKEERTLPVKVFVTQKPTGFIEDLIDKHSNFLDIVRILSWVKRYVHNLRQRAREVLLFVLAVFVRELNSATYTICAHIQQHSFPDEYKCCLKSNPVSLKSKLKTFVPFLDEFGVIRTKGRLRNADVSDATRHPIILPSDHKFVKDLVTHTHQAYLHAGPTLTMSILSATYNIIGARNLVRKVYQQCVVCFRQKPRMETPLMGDLPAVRVQENRPFYNTGCDFAGPFNFRNTYLRKSVITKGYICIFVCMATKMVHLEAVTDLSTERFIAALRRFMSRRGICGTIYCDNATNFVGATGATREERMEGVRIHNGKVVKLMSSLGTAFHYIPSYSPTFGGLWERGVGSSKTLLRKVIGDTALTYEEFSTILCQVEACLNSRPLCAKSSAPDDLGPLTPSHFAVGHALTLPPGPELMDMNPNLLTRWNLIQRFLQHFWHRWHTEYITSLQNRPKCYRNTKNLEVGDLVVLREPNLKPSQWKLGRILSTKPDKENVVRVVVIKTQDNIQQRAVSTLAKLPVPIKDFEMNSMGGICARLSKERSAQ